MGAELQKIVENYQDYTDKYFLRSKDILKAEGINPLVRYQIFTRTEGIVRGLDDAVYFIKSVIGNKARIYALKDTEFYQPCEPLMKIEGKVQDLINLETVYLGLISGGLTGNINMKEVRQKANAIVNSAQGKPVIYFGARHFHPALDEQIAKICQEEGFVGCSTDIGAKAWNSRGSGTIPHALILTYKAYLEENNIKGNPTVEAAEAFNKHIDDKVPRIVLIDTFNKEINDSLVTANALEDNLAGFRIDTCGENYAQGAKEIEPEISALNLDVPEKYLKGSGVSIAAVWVLRKALVKKNLGNLQMVVSSGFNEKKTRAFVKADKVFQDKYGFPLFTSIGTGSIANPKMTTSDICAYYNTKQGVWKPFSKVGRGELPSTRLKEVK